MLVLIHVRFATAGRGSTTTQKKKSSGWRRRSEKKSCVKLRWDVHLEVPKVEFLSFLRVMEA